MANNIKTFTPNIHEMEEGFVEYVLEMERYGAHLDGLASYLHQSGSLLLQAMIWNPSEALNLLNVIGVSINSLPNW